LATKYSKAPQAVQARGAFLQFRPLFYKQPALMGEKPALPPSP
jgi:hypothetical protein